MTVTDLLQDARERISDPTSHCRGKDAVDRLGRPVHPTDPGAVAWCASGSLARTLSFLPSTPWPVLVGEAERLGCQAETLLLEASQELYDVPSFTMLNDRAGHPAILRIFDRAIERSQRG